MKKIFKARPFKTRNADEFHGNDVLSLFISPLDGVSDPFDFENSIIRGKMGSGKTMFLRANHAFYIYTLIPSMINGDPITLPVSIKLSDFQDLKDPETIYRKIIVNIIEGLCDVTSELRNSRRLAKLHEGIKSIPKSYLETQHAGQTLLELKKLTSNEYVEKIADEISTKGSLGNKFIQASADFKKSQLVEIKKSSTPSIKDIDRFYNLLLGDSDINILLLVDEAGSLNRSFFQKEDETDSYFEILMNQLRTFSYIRTKVAIYPNSFQDILTASRYGNLVHLEEDVATKHGYESFRFKTENLIWAYLSHANGSEIDTTELFHFNNENDSGDAIEQAINASDGNMRRLVHILDLAMSACFKRSKGDEKVNADDVISAMRELAAKLEALHGEYETRFLYSVAKACRSRATFKFRLPHHSIMLNKYTSKSQEGNLLKVLEVGSGRRGSTYAFDYGFCVCHDIPTHNVASTERIDKNRSFLSGTRIAKVTQLTSELIAHSNIESKLEGTIEYYDGKVDWINDSDKNQYIFTSKNVLGRHEIPIHAGQKVRFTTLTYEGSQFANDIELL